jgi:hypothetical protein
MIFSNTNEADSTCLWTWAEVVFEPWQIEEIVTLDSRSLHNGSKSHRHKKPIVQVDIPAVEEARTSEQGREALSAPEILDICSSLCVAESHVGRRESLGSISNELDASFQYTMRAVKMLPKPVPQTPLRELLPHISRRDRLYIAAGLACGVIQFCGSWLKPWWDSSDVHLAADSDGSNVLPDNLYLSWPVSSTKTMHRPLNDTNYFDLGGNRLLPLGLALVELSLGKGLHTLLDLEDENQDTLVSKFKAASWLIQMVYLESGTNYADAVHSCLSWSALCPEKRFEERVFDTIVSPLLKDLVNFEGIA